MNDNKSYKTKKISDDEEIKYVFYSTGKRTISKLVAYTVLGGLNHRTVYNLGFGDYDSVTNTIVDDTISDNGDMMTVFNTVLHTIPVFFDNHPHDVITVQGSDSDDDDHMFEQKCRTGCKKKCTETCKNLNRRISIYKWFVRRHFDELIKEYLIFGSYKENKTNFTQYNPTEDEEYVAIMVYKKKSPTFTT